MSTVTHTSFYATAVTMTDNGYAVVPIDPVHRKKPIEEIDNWREYKFGNGHGRLYKDCGTGVLCGRVRAVDIDVRVPDVAAKIEAEAVKRLGTAPRRLGNAPKLILLYRTAKTALKITGTDWTLPGDGPKDKAHKVEILGDGEQFVAYGYHRDTGKPYRWNGAGDPMTVRADQLPLVTEAQLHEFHAAADAILKEAGGKVHGKVTLLGGTGGRKPSKPGAFLIASDYPDFLRTFLALPNEDDDRQRGWVNKLRAFYNGCGKCAKSAEAREAAHTWSKKHSSYDEKETDRVWDSFAKGNDRAPEDRLGAGTIYALAKAAAKAAKKKPVRRLVRKLAADLSTSAKGVAAMNVAPAVPLFEGAIYPGAYLLTGRPKIGKSWLELQMAIAAANGEPFLDFPAPRAVDVLYIAAEDNDARLQKRLNHLAGVGLKIPGNLRILNQEKFIETASRCAPHMTFVEWLARFADMYKDLRLVLVDTETTCRQIWAGERDAEKLNNRERATETDYRQTREFDQFALARQIVVALANHAAKRKGEWADIHELINRTGTAMAGVSGSIAMADPPDVHQLDGTSRVKVLGIRGRDLSDDLLLSIENAKDDAVFKNRGEWVEVQQTRNEDDLLEAVSELQEDDDTGAYITNGAIAKELGMKTGTVKRAISRMMEKGRTDWRGRRVQTKPGRSGGIRLVKVVGKKRSN